jgi:hypothetical protein
VDRHEEEITVNSRKMLYMMSSIEIEKKMDLFKNELNLRFEKIFAFFKEEVENLIDSKVDSEFYKDDIKKKVNYGDFEDLNRRHLELKSLMYSDVEEILPGIRKEMKKELDIRVSLLINGLGSGRGFRESI